MNDNTVKTVLLCGDVGGYLKIISDVFSKQGYTVTVCGNELSQEFAPDYVIIDWKGDEYRHTDYIKQIRSYSTETLVVVLSPVYSDSLKMKINSIENALYLLKPVDALTIEWSIKEFEKKKTKSGYSEETQALSDVEIEEFLLRLGFSKRLRGLDLLKECVLASLERPELLGSISKKLYSCVSEKVDVSPASVEKNIRAAISSAYNDGNNKVLLEFVKKSKCPTNGTLIKALYNHYIALV